MWSSISKRYDTLNRASSREKDAIVNSRSFKVSSENDISEIVDGRTSD